MLSLMYTVFSVSHRFLYRITFTYVLRMIILNIVNYQLLYYITLYTLCDIIFYRILSNLLS